MSTHPDCKHEWSEWAEFAFGTAFFPDGGRCGRERICSVCLDFEREYTDCQADLDPMAFASTQLRGRTYLLPPQSR